MKTTLLIMTMLLLNVANAQQLTTTVNPPNGSAVPENGTITVTYNKVVTYSYCEKSVIINGYDMSAFAELNDLRTVLTIPYDANDWKNDTLRIEISNAAIYDTDNNRAPLSLVFVKSGGTAIVETLHATSLRIYPNPTDGELTIVIPSDARELTANRSLTAFGMTGTQIEIFDMTGQRVYSHPAPRTPHLEPFTINISHLPIGTYILRIGNQVAKIVKQ
jgi:hypothetical protein